MVRHPLGRRAQVVVSVSIHYRQHLWRKTTMKGSSKQFTWVGMFLILALLLSGCAPAAPAAAPAAEATTEATTEAAAEATEAAAEEATAEAAEGGATGAIPEGTQVGLITKHRGNPFFVKMEEGATQEAEALGLQLMTAAGDFDGDNESQITAIENMMNAGVKGILLVANDSSAIVPTVQAARDAGMLIIALDTPLDPADATDALFATDNTQAGRLIGQYAKAALGDTPAKIVMLDGTAGTTVSEQRRNGFLEGFGITADDPQVVCQADTNGMIDRAQPAMENCLTANPDVNVVYTVNEPAAFGANTALEAAGITPENVVVVSVDGGCEGVRGVESGVIDATSQQYPLKMASMGVAAIADYIATGTKVSGYTDTGVTLIAGTPVEGVESQDAAYGLANCWGE
jgi:fructose transport system substrate-binding protein